MKINEEFRNFNIDKIINNVNSFIYWENDGDYWEHARGDGLNRFLSHIMSDHEIIIFNEIISKVVNYLNTNKIPLDDYKRFYDEELFKRNWVKFGE
jgi:hypothetical protein